MVVRLGVRLGRGVWLSLPLARRAKKVALRPQVEPFAGEARGRIRLEREMGLERETVERLDELELWLLRWPGEEATGLVRLVGGRWERVSLVALAREVELAPREQYFLLNGFRALVRDGWLNEPKRVSAAVEKKREMGL